MLHLTTPYAQDEMVELSQQDMDIVDIENPCVTDWGLEMLVKVGESWLPALLSMDIHTVRDWVDC